MKRAKGLLILIFLGLLVGAFVVPNYLIAKDSPSQKIDLHTVDVNNSSISYYTRGNGTPIILLPGLGMTMRDWDPLLLDKLSQKNKVVIFDYPGLGMSKSNGSKVSETQLASDIVAIMDSMHSKKANILGWSLGSFIAQVVAEKYPDRVDKLILVSTAPGGDQTVLPTDPAVGNEIQNNLDGSWEITYVPLLFPPEAEKSKQEYLNRIKTASTNSMLASGSLDRNALLSFEQAFANPEDEQNRYEQLSSIKSPTLIIVGGKDILLVPENSKRVATRIPNAKLVIVPNAGHAVLFQNVDQISNLINKFLQ